MFDEIILGAPSCTSKISNILAGKDDAANKVKLAENTVNLFEGALSKIKIGYRHPLGLDAGAGSLRHFFQWLAQDNAKLVYEYFETQVSFSEVTENIVSIKFLSALFALSLNANNGQNVSELDGSIDCLNKCYRITRNAN